MRTDAVTPYFTLPNSHWIVYDAPTSRFFSTDPLTNTVYVIDSVSEKEIARIPVPGAFSIDTSPDGSKLYVGTMVGDVYTIDPVAMKVTHRYLAAGIGPYGFQAWIALALSDGRVALLGGPGGILNVDGFASMAIWNPADNSISLYGSSPSPSVQTPPVCGDIGFHIGGFALTQDRKDVLIGSITGGTGGDLCEFSPSAGKSTTRATTGATLNIIVSPDGQYIALPFGPNSVVLYDQHTLAKVAQFDVAASVDNATNLAFSPDSQTLYVSDYTVVYAYDVATQQLIGWFPNIVLLSTSGGLNVNPAFNPIYEAADSTGLLVGPLEQGLGFLDTTDIRRGASPQKTAIYDTPLIPATGAASGGTGVQWTMWDASDVAGVYFGSNPAAFSSSFNGSTSAISATTPPGNAGPADVYAFAKDGWMQLAPEGFSYGPTILEVTPNIATQDGGGVGAIYGYGFGPTTSATPPPDLSVSVGGTPAVLVGYIPQVYSHSDPSPLQIIYFRTPPEVAGPADVTVTAGSGSATAREAMTYIPAAKQYPLPGASLAQGVYDPLLDLYYFTDSNSIQVFSPSQQSWLAPISLPAPSGTTQRLWGISLSPSGNALAVADIQANVIYVLDPSNPSSVQTFPFAPSELSGVVAHPAGVAMSDNGVVYVTSSTGNDSFFALDTNTGVLTDLWPSSAGGSIGANSRTIISSDGTRVYFNANGYVYSMDTATNLFVLAPHELSCCSGNEDLTLAPNQTQLAATDTLYDSDLNPQAFLTLNDREYINTSYVYGAKFNSDGSLLFQPSTSGIDVFDGRLGILCDRIALPFLLSTNYDALVSDGKDNVLAAITGTGGDGIAILDLGSLSEPAPLSYPTSVASRSPMSDQLTTPAVQKTPAKQTKSGNSPVKALVSKVPYVVNRNLVRPR